MKDLSLPKGMRLDRGYLQIRIMRRGRLYIRNFGQDSPDARELAAIHLSDKRKEIREGKFGIQPIAPSKPFNIVSQIYYEKWTKETDAEGKLRHSEKSCRGAKYHIATLVSYFKKHPFDSIAPKDVVKWRKTRKVSGTTVNREQVVLSSIFSHIEQWVKTQEIDAIALPLENPCQHVEKAPTAKRERLVTSYEISKLKLAARELGDENGRENVALAVKTCLSFNDLKKLKLGDVVDLARSKTGVSVRLPITVLHVPDWTNWPKRWDAIRAKAGLRDIELRDLRKAGGNLLLGRHDIKLISQYMGHANQKTTEAFYVKLQSEQMAPLAADLSHLVDSL